MEMVVFLCWWGMPLLRNKADWAGTMWADFELFQARKNLKAQPYSKQINC